MKTIISIPDLYVFRVPVNSWQQEGHVTKSHLPLKHPKFQLLDLQAVITRIISITFSFVHFFCWPSNEDDFATGQECQLTLGEHEKYIWVLF